MLLNVVFLPITAFLH